MFSSYYLIVFMIIRLIACDGIKFVGSESAIPRRLQSISAPIMYRLYYHIFNLDACIVNCIKYS